MERIFKVKMHCDQEPQDLYPSEKRYSASTVFGLSVVFLAFGTISTFMAILVFYKIGLHDEYLLDCNFDCTTETHNSTDPDPVDPVELENKVDRDLRLIGGTGHYSLDMPSLVASFCIVMAVGCFLSFATGLFAKIKWYVDRNIMLFFLSACFSMCTSLLCLGVALFCLWTHDLKHYSPLTRSILINDIIVFLLGSIWSGLSVKLAYQGVKNKYPEDMSDQRGGKTITVTKGTLNNVHLPPDIVSQFPKAGNLTKYLPKTEHDTLPKSESNYEYHQRVNNFITSSTEVNNN